MMFKEDCDQILAEYDSIMPFTTDIKILKELLKKGQSGEFLPLLKKFEDINDESALRYVQKGLELRRSHAEAFQSFLYRSRAEVNTIVGWLLALISIGIANSRDLLNPWNSLIVSLLVFLGSTYFFIRANSVLKQPFEPRYPHDILIMMIEAKLQKLPAKKEATETKSI